MPAAVRILSRDDLPAVAALFARAHPHPGRPAAEEFQRYFQEMLFDNPWRELELPSWIAEENGRVAGFQAVVPRPMHFRGRAIRVAVGCQMLVDPERRNGVAALKLAQAFLSGPQDLTLIDGANDQAQRMSTGLGGAAPLPFNLHWTRPLRPARYLLSLASARGAFPAAFAYAVRPLCGTLDALLARLRPNRFLFANGALSETALEPAAMLEHLPEMVYDRALRPEYDARSLAWLLGQAARKTRHGTLRARAVHNGAGLIGWYLYYLQPGGVSEVLQLVAREGSFDHVLQRALADAWRQGAAALRGRLEPRFVQQLSDRHCWLRREGTWTLVHSRDAEILAAIRQGDAFLSRLEGEWWMRFLGEDRAA